MVNLSLTT